MPTINPPRSVGTPYRFLAVVSAFALPLSGCSVVTKKYNRSKICGAARNAQNIIDRGPTLDDVDKLESDAKNMQRHPNGLDTHGFSIEVVADQVQSIADDVYNSGGDRSALLIGSMDPAVSSNLGRIISFC